MSNTPWDDYLSSMTAALKSPPRKTALTRRKAPGGVISMAAPKVTGAGGTAVFRFGSASFEAPARHGDWARNIGLGQVAMKTIGDQLVKPGVKLRTTKSTPLFRADPASPGQLIRVLDGKEERGAFENGIFKVRP